MATPDMSLHGGGEDHISSLSSALLSVILSRLDTADVARTAILSTRFRSMWSVTPLRLDNLELLAHT
ncbi:hypothetical protein E2562_011311 [Oryza meyeriana var. granulata]|uniref:F-box domain-containing protein n=1 Tax=Oryza meyeriana var. granulata TaxID=110450 RepID=A0A6G1BVW6_9ORYZ|nr:hypothetical protein E2562_011311 [Oryza meyeriana var. granulata]